MPKLQLWDKISSVLKPKPEEGETVEPKSPRKVSDPEIVVEVQGTKSNHGTLRHTRNNSLENNNLMNNPYNNLTQSLIIPQRRPSHAIPVDDCRVNNKIIDKKLEVERKNQNDYCRVLILGAPDSGKSTISKQLNIIYNNCFSNDSQRSPYRGRIQEVLYELSLEVSTIVIEEDQFSSEMKEATHYLSQQMRERGEFMNRCTLSAMRRLWRIPKFFDVFRLVKRELCYSELYFIRDWDRIMEKDYIPTSIDVLHYRERTGTIETDLYFGKLDIRLNDLSQGMSRSARAMRHLDQVSFIVFCVPLDVFDEPANGILGPKKEIRIALNNRIYLIFKA